MSDCVVLVPVLGRPHRVRPTLEGFAPHRVVFIPDPDDADERLTISAEGGEQMPFDGGYAAKINHAVRETHEPFIFLGADDLEPEAGWYEAACSHMSETIAAVGINDLLTRPRRPTHATHFLVHRLYAMQPLMDGSRGPLFEGYDHSCTDDEFIFTAHHRGVYAYAPEAHLRHLHPDGRLAEMDPTYQKGRAKMYEDIEMFRARIRQWT